jgi:hypothetical protein
MCLLVKINAGRYAFQKTWRRTITGREMRGISKLKCSGVGMPEGWEDMTRDPLEVNGRWRCRSAERVQWAPGGRMAAVNGRWGTPMQLTREPFAGKRGGVSERHRSSEAKSGVRRVGKCKTRLRWDRRSTGGDEEGNDAPSLVNRVWAPL